MALKGLSKVTYKVRVISIIKTFAALLYQPIKYSL